jgi:type I restriction enzyme M protein
MERNDIADIIARFKSQNTEGCRLRTDKSFLVPVAEIRENKYDLSINRYKEVVYEEKTYLKPHVIIEQIQTLDAERTLLMNDLKALLI